jgi:hypothetical protein
MLDLAELRLHLRDEYMRRGSAKDRLRPLRHIIPDALSPQNKDTTTTSTSSDEIHLEITPETNMFDLDGDENLLTFAEALGQRSVLDDVEDPAAGPPHSRRFSNNLCHWHFKHWRISMLSGFLTPHKRP